MIEAFEEINLALFQLTAADYKPGPTILLY
jgi:hypothetical protein